MSAFNKQSLQGTFKERLYQARVAQGWSQSDLARKIWGTYTDGRGYETARNRDRISSYERGKSVPERQNLDALAEALEVSPEELAPDVLADIAATGRGAAPAVQMTMMEGQPDLVHLQVDVVTKLSTASQIIKILSDDL